MTPRKILIQVKSNEIFLELLDSIVENGFYFLKNWDDFFPEEPITLIFLVEEEKDKHFIDFVVKKCIKGSGSIIVPEEMKNLVELISTIKGESSHKETVFALLQRMSVDEKKRFALKCDRTERSYLVRDVQKSVHLFVFKNPKITVEEVVEYTRNPSLSPEAIVYIIKNPTWIKNSRIRMNIATNPSLPVNMVKTLLNTFPDSDLKKLARNTNIRPDVTAYAKKILMDKGKL